MIFRPQRDVTWAYVGGVSGALGGRLPFPVYDVFGGVFGALGGRLPFPDSHGGAGNNGCPLVGPWSSIAPGAESAEAAVVALGGRPLSGGCATLTSPCATWAIFKRSMEILSVLVPSWTSNQRDNGIGTCVWCLEGFLCFGPANVNILSRLQCLGYMKPCCLRTMRAGRLGPKAFYLGP